MPTEPFVPISAWYTGGRVRAPLVDRPDASSPDEWRRDLETMRGCGFNAVRSWVDWASAERRPGDWQFESLDLLLRLAGEVGLRVLVQVYLDCAPDWIAVRHPDARYVAPDGTPIDSQGSPGFCYDHPAVRDAAERFLVGLAKRLADEPAFLGWDLWSEPHVVQWSYFDFLNEPALFCYCPHTVARFRGWLQDRYGELDGLNQAWQRGFGTWEEVQPPRFTTLMTYTDRVDWLRFVMDKLSVDLRWRHDAVRRADSHVTSSHSAVPSVVTLPSNSHGSPDDWRMVDSVDVWGTSLYPKHVGAQETGRPYFRSAMLAATRSACGDRPFWIGELQGGHGYVGTFAARVTGDDVRTYAWECLAHGAKGLHFYAWYPMTSGIESAGFGLANLDGTPNERTQAAGQVAEVVDRHADLFAEARPPRAQLAICWNVHANLMWTALRESWHYVPSRSYVGAYRALYDGQLPADFVHMDEIERAALDRYRVLYLPFGLMLTRKVGARIDTFVRMGGLVLAEARTGWNDETGYCDTAVPGMGLDGVFGCREAGADGGDGEQPVRIRMVREHPALPGVCAGDWIQGAVFRQVLEPVSAAEVVGVFEDGLPAIVAHRHGEGWAVLAGSLMSLGYHRFHDEATGRFLRGMANAAGVEPPARVLEPAEGVEARLLERPGGHEAILFVFNHCTEGRRVRLELRGEMAEFRDLQSGHLTRCRSEAGMVRVDRKLAPNEVWVAQVATAQDA